MRPYYQPSPARRFPAGFTLVEVLLSLGLLMLVLAAAYSALVLFQRVTYLGRRDAELSQLARAIESRIAADIRCVRFEDATATPAQETGAAAGEVVTMDSGVGAADDTGGTTTLPSTSSSASLGSSTTTETAPDTSDPLTAYMTQGAGLFGTPTTLVLHVSRPQRELGSGATPSPLDLNTLAMAATSSEWRSVSYFLAIAGTGGLQGAVGNTAAGGTASYSLASGSQGLARLDEDRLMVQQVADTGGGVDQLAQGASVLAPEVTEIQFRYFDGVSWVESWDSVAMNSLPKAVEVTLWIDPDANDEKAIASLAGGVNSVTASSSYRFVVSVPLADPLLGQEL